MCMGVNRVSDNKKNLIESDFNVVGKGAKTILKSFYTVTSDIIPFESDVFGNKNLSVVTTGQITKNNEYDPFNNYVSNAKITALKNGIVYDYDTTREDGRYFLFLERGLYDIRIESQIYNRTIKNYQVREGVREYREDFKSGRIRKKVYDSIEINGAQNKRLITSEIVDEHGKVVPDVEIIIILSRDINILTKEIVAFVKTDKDGRFSFIVNGVGPYDVIVRSPNHHAKVFKNYKFDLDKGFFQDLQLDNLRLKKDSSWIKIDEVEKPTKPSPPIVVDTYPPTKPQNIQFKNLDSDPEWELDWEDSSDTSGEVRYEVYADDVLIGKTNDSYFDFSGSFYSYYNSYFAIKALDIYGNYSYSDKKKPNI